MSQLESNNNEKVEKKNFVSKKTNQVFLTLSTTAGSLAFGCIIAWTSPGLPSLEATANFEIGTGKSWIASISPLSAVFGAFIAGFLISKIGRRNTFLLTQFPYLSGWLIITYAQSLPVLLVGRSMTGFCCGVFTLILPVFVSECVEKHIRGSLNVVNTIAFNTAVLWVYVMGKWLSWKTLAVVCGTVPLAAICVIVWIPESPRFLVSKGRMKEATASLMWLRGAKNPSDIEDELKIICKSNEEARANRVSLKDEFRLFLVPATLKPVMIVMAAMFFQRFNGSNAVLVYTVEIFHSAGTDVDSHWSTIIIGTLQLLASIFMSFSVEKVGRRWPLILSGLGMGIGLTGLGIFFQMKANDEASVGSLGWLPLLSLSIFIFSYGFGFGPLPWLLMGEILPNHIIGRTAALATAWTWLSAFLVTYFFQDVNNAIGIHWCFWIFAIFSYSASVFMWTFLPETKGKSLEEIQQHFRSSSK